MKNTLLPIFTILKNIFSYKISHHGLSKLIYLTVIFILLLVSFYAYKKEKQEVENKYNIWGQRISARNNIDGVFSYYQKDYPFITQFMNHLQQKDFSYKEQSIFLEKKKQDTQQKFTQEFIKFRDWINENKWPKLTKIVEELLPLIQNITAHDLETFSKTFSEQLQSMEEITDGSTLDAFIKAKIFIHIRNLKNLFAELSSTNKVNIKEKKPIAHDQVKKDFQDIFMTILSDAIEVQNEKINEWNTIKKQSFFLVALLTLVLLIRFVHSIYLNHKKKGVQFSKIKTSQLIIDLLYELEEIGQWLSQKDLFSIEQENDDIFIDIKYTIGGIELDKKSLHFEHTLRNGKKRSLFDLFKEFKDRSVKFNCCNYYKDNDQPHSFSITLKIRTSR
ncbi:MAG: hypothetical protein A2381_07065 [Bdellovibrionales bacterium RIFOXYB1_FULL_37_110]|nr:MAG: hypothetical protein A2417_14940 [Bdellovibrionales bacterium RIFOXYC1_FULL_37_79]OFZ57822.1 MAG: hypothetical protein A2381_07065 [Bdellovibrionales bacterium RIFOXYB1_FULL_37_110]OFZ62788.1 MAG: hypothetical protein A2577_16585 [Bdellovibrionales bacterium RIFOXYD1_FULL_36_51]